MVFVGATLCRPCLCIYFPPLVYLVKQCIIKSSVGRGLYYVKFLRNVFMVMVGSWQAVQILIQVRIDKKDPVRFYYWYNITLFTLFLLSEGASPLSVLGKVLLINLIYFILRCIYEVLTFLQ